MEIVLLVLAVLVLAGLGLGVLVARRRSRGELLEPPPAEPTRAAGTATAAPSAPALPGESLDLDEETVDEIEDALAVATEPEAPPRFRDRLGRARSALSGYLGAIRSRSGITAETWDELEEAMIRADVGVRTTTALLDDLRKAVAEQGIVDPELLLAELKAELKGRLGVGDRSLTFEPGRPNVWLFVGVNGVGKTTSIGKVGRQQADLGRGVVMAAGDTFRAAAAEQLGAWAERTGADLVRGEEGGDPSSVIFDAVQRAGSRGSDLVLADTAGRLHTKVNLMEELRKVRRVADREPGKVTEVLLVIDATTGQNGLTQAKEFADATDVTGIVLTKLDGSAKGGIVIAISEELGIPIKLVGLGETVVDLVEFDPDEFVEALFA
ncbi:MAG: signal recognition particle-docking protein FtsY [Acidimicrobiia bacterium]